jgi:hypothetical protein
VVLLFCPSGFSVVVVLELLWANPALPSAKLSPMAAATNFDVGLMVYSSAYLLPISSPISARAG